LTLIFKVIARETASNEEFYEAVSEFENEDSYVCDGQWHTIRANYVKGSITLRIDNLEPIFALNEPTRPSYTNGNSVVGSLFIGGIEGNFFFLILTDISCSYYFLSK